jgi:hypothetical protein
MRAHDTSEKRPTRENHQSNLALLLNVWCGLVIHDKYSQTRSLGQNWLALFKKNEIEGQAYMSGTIAYYNTPSTGMVVPIFITVPVLSLRG